MITMRRAPLLLFSCALATGAMACSDLTDAGIVNDEDPLTSENGLTSNGLTSNGLTSNGLTSNGLTSNGLTSNGITSNALVMQALRDQSATGPLSRLFFRYLVSCALGPNHSVTYTWTDTTGQLHTEVNPGGLGLAPYWESGPPSQTDKEVVSACLGARTNSKGVTVPLSLRGKNISGLSVTSAERASYTFGEGAFWGNVFTSPPHLYSCSRVAFNAGVNTSQYLAQGRTCAAAGCGLITYVGACYTSDIATTGQTCYDRDGSKDWVSTCNAQKSKFAASTDNVLTTWLLP
jgi:GLTT repeat (6 copies)